MYVDSGLPVCQVLGDPLVHTSRYTTFLELQAELIFPDLGVHLFHVCPHRQSMLFILKASFDFLGNVGVMIFSRIVLPKASSAAESLPALQ